MKTNPLELRMLRLEDETSFRTAISEFQKQDPDWTFAFDFDSETPFVDYLDRLEKQRVGRDLAPGRVPASYLVAIVNGQVVGRVSIRHVLNEYLAHIGGHIGYGVVPAFRRRGYASEMLRLTLPYARSVGIEKALLTCDDDNIGSFRVIEAHGGVLENKVVDEGILKRRYWIDLSGSKFQ